jgi:hypothetical protein
MCADGGAGYAAAMRTPVISTVFALALLVAGCGASEPPVDWGGKYTATAKARLDKLIQAKDCDGLQAELATAKATNAAKKRLDGSGTADLVAYIEYGLDKAGCPKS